MIEEVLEPAFSTLKIDSSSLLSAPASILVNPSKSVKEHSTSISTENAGGPWIHLPQVIVDLILMYVGEVDSCAMLIGASKSVFQPNETVYQFLCHYIYLQQTVKQFCVLNSRWLTWKSMLMNRPRLRTNGFYTLRTTYTKSFSNDAFWEEKRFESIEVNYYRHFRFYHHGKVIYNLDILTPPEITRWLSSGEANLQKKIYIGQYRLKKNYVWIEIPLPYCFMIFECKLLHGKDLFNPKHPEYAYYATEEERQQYNGHFTTLKLIAHYSRPATSSSIFYNNAEPVPLSELHSTLGNVVAGQGENEDNVNEQPQLPAIVRYPIPPHNYFYFHRRMQFFS